MYFFILTLKNYPIGREGSEPHNIDIVYTYKYIDDYRD